jgi:hypothetical protein
MDRSLLRRLLMNESEALLNALSTRQHLRPHEPLGQSLSHVGTQFGVCPDAAAEAMRWLELDPAKVIGRLRRTELTQLARSIHRIWRQREPHPDASEAV